MTFTDLDLCAPVQQAVKTAGYTTPTPIQEQAIPVVLSGKDIFGIAQTGTGKTAAFALPILTRLHNENRRGRTPLVVVLAPTRELATQIGDSFYTYSKRSRQRILTVFGGVSIRPQISQLRRGVDILIATPGRLIDLMEQREVDLRKVHTLVLDEADRMLDMGFQPQIKQVIKDIPTDRQTLFFSATMPKEIERLASKILRDPVHVAVAAVSATADRVAQSSYRVQKTHKRKLLLHLLESRVSEQVLIFTRTKRGADRLAKDITKAGIGVAALHGNKSQSARQQALQGFKNGKNRVLVATDIASRGIDISELPFVINFDLPDTPETYVHRIGRTGRAGFEGEALTLFTPEEGGEFHEIEKLIDQKIPRIKDHPFSVVRQTTEVDTFEGIQIVEEKGGGQAPPKKKPQHKNGPPQRKKSTKKTSDSRGTNGRRSAKKSSTKNGASSRGASKKRSGKRR